MVKKLLRYEFAANLKLLLPMELIVLGTAVLNRILQLFEADTSAYRISFGSSVVLLMIAIIASFIGVAVITVRRYYKSMFSNEGYLTMALPVTPAQHIFSKGFSAFISVLIVVVGAVLAGIIATSGDLFTEILKAIGYLYKVMKKDLKVDVTWYVIECIVTAIVQSIQMILLFYACLSIGQRSKKNRVAMSVVAFVVYYFIVQILATVSTIVLSTQLALLQEYSLLAILMENPRGAVHAAFLVALAINLILSVIFYWISHRTLSKKLNLE